VSATASRPGVDPAILRARHTEDVVVGEEIVRHRLASRAIHWAAALFFFVSLLSGLPIWAPIFGGMASLFGGLAVCRWLHPWAGVLFFASMLAMFVHWLGDMWLQPADREWLRPRRVAAYMRHEEGDAEAGKYNGGQKLFFFAVVLGAAGLLLSGIVLWLAPRPPLLWREAAILLHDVTFILFVVAVVLHVYLGTAAEPGTFASMVRGTVRKPWARLHHPRWYREVVGEDRHRP
jgi:formate dehydrogenase subunit gamma